jgi:type IX secretion system PorP/SprF family membrane protein
MKWKLLCSISVLFICAEFRGTAQDLHFSQYFNQPLLINPANTGFAPDADYRFGVNYRNQWSSLINNPYKTFSAWGDVQLLGNQLENGWLGVGGYLMRDVAGSGSLTATRAAATVAYHQMLSDNNLISVGMSAGYTNKSINVGKLTFDNQWNGQFFDVTVPSGENFAYTQTGYFDLGAGVNLATFPSDNVHINTGFSLSHINRPSETFFSNNQADTRLAMRATAFANAAIKANDHWIVNPNVYVSKMGNVYEVVGGLNANYNLSGDGLTQFVGGLYYRGGEAVIPMFGIQWSNLKMILSYDATVSSLKNYNNGRGAYELGFIFSGLFNTDKPVKCPTVKF